MKKVFLILVGWLYLLSGWAAESAGAPEDAIPVLVVGITDGDTLTGLTTDKRRIRVRLAEIDAPESSQAFGQRSKQSLSDLCFLKQAKLDVQGQDRYGRLVAEVYCDGKSAQEHQLASGMAWVYDRYVKSRALYGLQESAQRRRVGLWSDPSPVPPWEFRHR